MSAAIGPRRRRRARGRTRGVLFILASFLVTSALIRLGDGAGQAMALASDPPEASAVADPLPTCESSEDLQHLLELLQQRERAVETREEDLRDRMQALRVAEEEVSEKIAALRQAEDDLRRMIAMAETASENDVTQLTKVYEAMKPKQAAALFEEMDPAFAAGFLARIRPEAAADILAGMNPAAAHGISVIMAGRNARVPRE